MKAKTIYTLLGITTALYLMSCSTKKTEETTGNSDFIEITKEQFQTENMEFGKPEKHVFKNKIQFSGKIVPTANGMAKISVPIEGTIEKLYVQPGQRLKRGEKIMEIGGNAMIDLQQQITSSVSKLKHLTAEYERARILYEDNIKVQDEFFKIESNYKSELGNYSALKLKLQRLGITVSDIENGDYHKTYIITAPIEGQIVNLECNLGQFVSAEQYIAEIVNNNQVQVKISLFEKDLSLIEINQKIAFNIIGDNQEYNGEIRSISKLINNQTKSSNCYAEILNTDNEFSINQFVNGSIIIDSDTLLALPSSAIIKSGELDYVLLSEGEQNGNYHLRKVSVNTGMNDDNYTEIKDDKLNSKILINGIYNINVE